MKKFLRKLAKKRIILVLSAMIIIFIIIIAIDFSNTVKQGEDVIADRARLVEVIDIGQENNQDIIKTTGTVKAESSIEVIALSAGTLRSVNFEIGQAVAQGQVLASLQNNSLSTSYSNAQIGIANTKNTNQSMLLISEESLRQAENGVANALKSVEAAKIGVQVAEHNLENALALQTKNNQDLKNNSITGYYDYLNTINNNLNKINYILKAEGDSQMPGIGLVLGAKDGQSLINARNDYWEAKKSYETASEVSLTVDNIETNYKVLILALEDMKTLIDDMVIVLDETVTSYDFPQASLNTQKDIFTGYRTNMVISITNAKRVFQSLENIEINNKRETDVLKSALDSAKNQLKIAEIGHQNFLSALNNAKQAKEQQILINRSAVDSQQGQLNLIGTQVADLNVKAPIAGRITKKYVEAGAEVQPGQRIAQVSQDERLKIEINLNSRDIYRIKLGQDVKINNEINGQISLIEPVADPVTKKIRAEISFDKKEANLILGSFVDVAIPLTELRKVSDASVFVPLKALTVTHNENYVFTAVEGIAVKTIVEIGETQGSLIEILSGLNNGDKVITEGAKLLEDGDKIIIN
ncbi:MAG: efflux RND transporter periplasmic adaptor subunit [bacterium]